MDINKKKDKENNDNIEHNITKANEQPTKNKKWQTTKTNHDKRKTNWKIKKEADRKQDDTKREKTTNVNMTAHAQTYSINNKLKVNKQKINKHNNKETY